MSWLVHVYLFLYHAFISLSSFYLVQKLNDCYVRSVTNLWYWIFTIRHQFHRYIQEVMSGHVKFSNVGLHNDYVKYSDKTLNVTCCYEIQYQ